MVLSLYPPNTPSPLTEKYGVLYFPVLADLAVNMLFSRKANFLRIAEAAGVAAGVGVFALFARRTSTSLSFLGAGLYLACKVGQYFYLAYSESYLSIESLRKAFDKVGTVIIEYPDEINSQDKDFLQKMEDFKKHNEENIRTLCTNPTTQLKIFNVMQQAQAILFDKFSRLQSQTAHLGGDLDARNDQMAHLLNEAFENGDDSFERALKIFNIAYRQARGFYHYFHLSQLPSDDEDRFHQSYLMITEEDGKAFIEGPGLPHQMNLLYNDTHEKLDSLLQVSIYHHDDNVKDEEPLPGDDLYYNQDNPFCVGHYTRSEIAPIEERDF